MNTIKTRNYLFLATALFILLSTNSYSQINVGVNFVKSLSWTQIKAKAEAEHKYIFMDVFATRCSRCMAMDEDIYLTDTVGRYMNENFISVKVQIDRTKEDNEEIKSWYKDAADIGKTYNVTALPGFLFFSPKGRLVTKGVGYKDINEFLIMAKEALDPHKQYYTLLQEYNNGKITYELMPDLVAKAKSLRETTDANKIAKDYIDNYLFRLNEKDLFTKEHLRFIAANIGSKESRAFELFLKEGIRIDKILYRDAAVYAIKNFIMSNYVPKSDTWENKNPDWDEIEKNATQKFGSLGQEAIYGRRMVFYLNTGKDWEYFGKYYMLYFKLALTRPDFNINDITWVLFEHVTDQVVLSFACDSVMKYAMDRWYVPEKNVNAYDTYANLLYRTGKVKEAIKWEEEALKMSKGTDNEKVFSNVLEKMRRGEVTWKTSQPTN